MMITNLLLQLIAPKSFSQDLPFIWRKYSSPEEAGWSSTKLEMVNEYTTNLGSIVVMVVYKDRALISLGDIEKKS